MKTLCFGLLALAISFSACKKVDSPGGGNETPPPPVYGPEDYQGSYDVSHNCNVDVGFSTVPLVESTVSISDAGGSGITFEEWIRGIGSNHDLDGTVDDRDFDIPSQTITIIEIAGSGVDADINGSGSISDDKNTISVNLDYAVGAITSGSCTCTLTRQ